MPKILIANWKMNPQTLSEAMELFSGVAVEAVKFPGVKTIICPPFVFLEELAKLSGVELGAQDIFWEKKGAFTGEISTEMLKNLGIKYVLVGHSDRRYTVGETDETINKKIRAALAAEITPILLVGEREGENKEGVITKQLTANLAGLTADEISRILLTYEPVWAISTNPGAKADSPENAMEAMDFMRKIISEDFGVKIESFLYGGSVNEKTVVDFFRHPEIAGGVVGGASLRREEFVNMIKLVSEIK